jgi:hypothetical protein
VLPELFVSLMFVPLTPSVVAPALRDEFVVSVPLTFNAVPVNPCPPVVEEAITT